MKSSNPFALWRWEKMFGEWQMFGEGFLLTIEVAALALILALVLGIIFGVISTSNNKIMRGIARVYVEFFQNTPLVIQVFFLYNGLAIAGLRLSVFLIGVLGVGIYHGAYVSEVVKAGITSIPVGQVEAAKSQGFTYVQYMRYIILPQTVKIVLPPLTNQAVNLIKNTSVLAMISGFDLMYMADSWASLKIFRRLRGLHASQKAHERSFCAKEVAVVAWPGGHMIVFSTQGKVALLLIN